MTWKMGKISVMVALTVFSCVSKVWAAGSGGFRVETPDAEAYGKGTAFVGEASNPSTIYYNPAGMTQLKGANHLSMGTAILQPHADYTSTAGGEVKMKRGTFVIPHFYYVTDAGLEKFVFGIGTTSNWGLVTEWAQDSFSKYVATKSEIANADTYFSAAYAANEQWSFAFSFDNDASKASKEKKLLQPGGADGDFQLKADSISWGYRLATLFKLNKQHQFGLMYRSEIDHKYRGKAYLDGLNHAYLDYQSIFGNTTYETDITEEFTLPQSIVLGYSFKPTNKWTFNFDLEWMDWSSVEHERIVFESEKNATRLAILNDGNPASRDWAAVFSQSVGAEYQWNDRFRLRGGYYHHTTPIPEAVFEPSLPDANTHGITGGFGYDFNPNLTIDLAYSVFIYEDRKIDNNVGASSGVSIDGKYEQFMNIGLITLNYKF